MLQNLISMRQFRLTKWSFLVHSTTCNAPYIHPSHDSILELWRTFPNEFLPSSSNVFNGYTQLAVMLLMNICSMQIDLLLVFIVDTLHSISK